MADTFVCPSCKTRMNIPSSLLQYKRHLQSMMGGMVPGARVEVSAPGTVGCVKCGKVLQNSDIISGVYDG